MKKIKAFKKNKIRMIAWNRELYHSYKGEIRNHFHTTQYPDSKSLIDKKSILLKNFFDYSEEFFLKYETKFAQFV